jgi:hypothetical protein
MHSISTITAAFLVLVLVGGTVDCLPVSRTVMVWRHMLPEVTENTKFIDNNLRIGKLFQRHEDEVENNTNQPTDVIIISPFKRFRLRRDLSRSKMEKNTGGVTYFRLCVTFKNGKCIRKKRFGMWHATREEPIEKSLT